jgi:GAF domain-containing protein
MRGFPDRVRAQCGLIAEHARAVTGAPRAILLLYNEQRRRLVTVAAPGSDIPLQQVAIHLIRRNYPGLDPLDLAYPPTINRAVAAAFVGQRTQVNTMAEAFENIFPPPIAVLAHGLVGVTHAVSCPVVAEGRALGLIRFLVGGPPGDAQLALMEACASQIALTIANAELAEQMRRQLAAARAIREVARLAANGGPEATLAALADQVRELTRADSALVFLADPDGETYSLAAQSLSDRARAADVRDDVGPARQIGIGLAGWVIASGEAAFVPDVRRDPRAHVHRIQELGGAVIAVPMRVGSGTVGCLRLSVMEKRRFAEADLWLAQTLADEAALAVERAEEVARARAEGFGAGPLAAAREATKAPPGRKARAPEGAA